MTPSSTPGLLIANTLRVSGRRIAVTRNDYYREKSPSSAKIPVPKILKNKPQTDFRKCNFSTFAIAVFFRAMHSAGIQTAAFSERYIIPAGS